ncbi:MAG: hypothetical protein Q8K60_08700 [Parachlamydiaceae bacterium]|nr:hypothetical protein [Parachlamydiaceae bacterium]
MPLNELNPPNHLNISSVKSLNEETYREDFALKAVRPDGTLGPFVGKYLIHNIVSEIFEKYKDTRIPVRCVVATHVLSDGLGDYYHAVNVTKVLKIHFPHWNFTLIAEFDDSKIKKENLTLPDIKDSHIFFLDENNKDSAAKKIEKSDIVVNIPVSLNLVTEHADKKKVLKISEYGNPGFTAMGVGPSSWGIVIGSIDKGSIHEIKDSKVLKLLTGSEFPSYAEIEHYRETKDRFFGYIKTSFASSLAYFYTTLSYANNSLKDMDVFLPFDVDAIEAFSFAMDLDFLKDQGIGRVQLVDKDGNVIKEVNAGEGKSVRWLNVFPIKQNEVHFLIQDSSPLTGCSGDISIGEVITANKDFFYEGRRHKSKFVTQLIYLAEKNFGSDSLIVEYLKIQKNLYANIEDFFGPLSENPSFINTIRKDAEQMAKLASSDLFKEEMKDLRKIITNNFNFNKKIASLVSRHMFLTKYPDISTLEEKIAIPLTKGKISEISFNEYLNESQKKIENYIKNII